MSDTVVGTLVVTIQAADGRLLEKSISVGLRAKPEIRKRKPRQSVTLEIRFCAPDGADLGEIKRIFGEEQISTFGASYEQVFTDPDDAKRAAEICLNFDKALRLLDREKTLAGLVRLIAPGRSTAPR